jgi:hypothetical protein
MADQPQQPAKQRFSVLKHFEDGYLRIYSDTGIPAEVLQAYVDRTQQQAAPGHRLTLEEQDAVLDEWVECSPDKPIPGSSKLRVRELRAAQAAQGH